MTTHAEALQAAANVAELLHDIKAKQEQAELEISKVKGYLINNPPPSGQ